MVRTVLIDDDAAMQRLNRVGTTLGDWHRVEYLAADPQRATNWRNALAPSDAKELLAFSQKILDWLPDNDGYVVVFENSHYLDAAQQLVIEGVLQCSLKPTHGLLGALAVEYESVEVEAKIRVAYLIFFGLMFETFFYIVSSRTFEGPILGVLDGCAYFMLKNEGNDQLDAFVMSLQSEKTTSPNWVAEYGSNSAA